MISNHDQSKWAKQKKAKQKKAYEVAVDTRKFEIGLVWSRSLVFWGFIASAFAAYALLRKYGSDLSVIVACFGATCSFAWTLANRGSKYWQESWETKVNEREDNVTGVLFKKREERQDKGWWLSAREFSVSKLAIALSDYTFIVWLFIASYELLRICTPDIHEHKRWGAALFALFTLAFGLYLLKEGRSTSKLNETEQNNTEKKDDSSPKKIVRQKENSKSIQYLEGKLQNITDYLKDISAYLVFIGLGVIVAKYYKELPLDNIKLGIWFGLLITIMGFVLLWARTTVALDQMMNHAKGWLKRFASVLVAFVCIPLVFAIGASVVNHNASKPQQPSPSLPECNSVKPNKLPTDAGTKP